MVLSKNAKLANKQKSTFDKANKNKGFSKVQQFPRIEEITKINLLQEISSVQEALDSQSIGISVRQYR